MLLMSHRSKALNVSLVLIAAIAAVVIVAILAVYSAGHIGNNTSTASKDCASGHPMAHQVTIQNSKVNPSHTEGVLCDTLTITNRDNTQRLVAFGLHDHHVAYDGITERLLARGQSVTVTLNQTGNFKFHDHLHDEVEGTFTVIR